MLMKRTIFSSVLVLSFLGFSLDTGRSEQLTFTFQAIGSSKEITATLIKPEREGLFPAVVVMHDCSGLGPRSSGAPQRWAQELVSRGYVALIPDSFTPRGFPGGVCTVSDSERNVTNGHIRAGDAYGALATLRKIPYIDGNHIGIMGGSHGGWTALAAMSAPISESDPLSDAKRKGFSAAVAFYPSCAARYGTWSTVRQNKTFGPVVSHSGVYKPIGPVLILIGEKDDWTPAEDCRKMVVASRNAGFPVSVIIYPGAHHSFDSDTPVRYNALRTNASSPSGKGATTGGDSAAWLDSKKQVVSFFDLHLKP